MKHLLTLAMVTLMTVTTRAHADVPTPAAGVFESRYTLDNFQIASGSAQLSGIGTVTSGNIEINRNSTQLRLTLERHIVCPRGVMCIQMMPAPTVVTLPIRKIDTDTCGGLVIVAERNLLVVDGGLTRIEIQDSNGAGMGCSGNADDVTFVKRVKVMVTESGLRGQQNSLSMMSGFPAQR